MKPPKQLRLVASPEDEWEYELFQEALGLLKVPNDQYAGPLIRSVIQMFKDDLEQARTAPRISDLRKKLKKISQHSRGLARLLDDVDPYFLGTIYAYTSTDDWPWGRDLKGRDRRGFNDFLDPLVSEPTQFKTMLSDITKGADLVLKKMPKDTGGEGNLFDILYQSPKRILAVHCWELFWQFRPEDARGKPKSDLHTFSDYLFVLATGEPPNETSTETGMFSHVKKASKICNEIIDRNPALDRLRRSLAVGESTLGLISKTGLAASLFGSPQQLMNSLLKKPEKHEN